ncbi:MAG: hypothetical protein JWP72_2602 [Massilia sp.]|nr:hypothetical protein [Massilia sp.]MDB5790197.1 hypothetical protein [Massilia sp.]
MNAKRTRIFIVVVLAAITTAFLTIPPKPTVLVVDMDMPYDEVVRRSTYPARAHGVPPTGETGFATIDVIEPSVIIKYVDPRHGFELPPTKFAALTFDDAVLGTISTSPMLEALRFPEAVEVLGQVQERFKAGGWVPWVGNQNGWYDLSPEGQKALHAELLRYSQSDQWFNVPKRNLRSLLRIKCVEDCDDADDALYLIDVGIGKKSWYAWDGE